MLEPFAVSTKEGSGTARLIPTLERREVSGPGGQEQLCHLVPFELASGEHTRLIRLNIPDSLVQSTRTDRGTLLDDEQWLARLLRHRMRDASASLSELAVSESDVRAVAPTMQVTIRSPRTFSTEWERAYNVPRDQLPPLAPEDKERARSLHMSDEEYARNQLATEWSAKKQLARTARIARFLQQKLEAIDSRARIEQVVLDALLGKYEVEISINGSRMPATIRESVVDELFEAGSPDAEQRISRILELTVRTRGE
jgi:hypothetical protein